MDMNLADLERRYERNERAADFVKLAGILMTTGGAEPGKALARAKSIKAGSRVQELLSTKAAIAGSTTTGLGSFGQPLANGFLDTLRNVSAFDRIAGDGLRVPLHPTRIIINSSVIVASGANEGAAKTVQALSLVTSDIVPQKVACQIVLSRSLIDALDDEGLRALGRELRVAVAVGTDTAALAVLATGNSGEASGVPGDFGSMLNDLEELTRNVELTASSRPYFITTPQIAKGLSRAATANGVVTVGLLGGEILGVPVVVSDGQAPGKITLVDARQIAVADEPITLRSSENAALEMSDTPSHDSTTPTATTLVSMFQTNCRALLAERHFAVKVLKATGVATLTGVEWSTGGGSPAGF